MKETKEALIAAVTLYVFVKKRLADGLQLEDAIALGEALVKDGEFKTKVLAGYQDAELIAKEFEDFTIVKGLELAQIVPTLVEMLQPQKA
jgi:hypothetical protein